MTRIWTVTPIGAAPTFITTDAREAEFYRSTGALVTESVLTGNRSNKVAAVILWASIIFMGWLFYSLMFGYWWLAW